MYLCTCFSYFFATSLTFPNRSYFVVPTITCQSFRSSSRPYFLTKPAGPLVCTNQSQSTSCVLRDLTASYLIKPNGKICSYFHNINHCYTSSLTRATGSSSATATTSRSSSPTGSRAASSAASLSATPAEPTPAPTRTAGTAS